MKRLAYILVVVFALSHACMQDAFAVTRTIGSTLDSNGVIPTSLFNRVFLKRHLEYIALDPPATSAGINVEIIAVSRAAKGEK